MKEFQAFLKKYLVVLISFTSISFVLICWLYTYYILKDYNENDRGTFCDMFGGINALFSGLAFCGIIITILLQSKELKLQRDEIKANRDELIRTTEVQKQQGISLNRQAENLKISAKLSALNTLVNYYIESAQISNRSVDVVGSKKNLKKAEEYVKKIEEILTLKNS